ncbi:MAG TPA: TolC family protein [Gammaproteobacteria bacterium]|nr:TolC family protein [Gammaproteobacteria bacterium]
MKRLLLLGALLPLVAVEAESPPVADPGPTELQETLTTPLDLRLRPSDLRDLPTAESQGPLRLSLEEAVLYALRYNRGLTVQQLTPQITGAFEAIERAAFDPALFSELGFNRSTAERASPDIGRTFPVESQGANSAVGLRTTLPTGTDLEGSVSYRRQSSNRTPDPQYVAGLNLSVTQALLRGGSRRANLVNLRQAELDTLASRYELRGFATALVADVEQTYWDYVLAAQRLAIFESSLHLAERQLQETEQRIRAGALPEAERAAARAEVARRRQELIDARANHDRQRLALLRLLSPPSLAGWQRPVEALSRPLPPAEPLDPVAEHIALSQRLRAELNEAKLRLRQGKLEVIQTRNGLLPRLDLFIVLGKTGYAASFGDAFQAIDGDTYDLSAGLLFEYPLGNRRAEAQHRIATLQQAQAQASLDNLAQLVALEVQQAYLEAQRAAAQIDASRATRELQQSVLEAEQARLRAGRSTSLSVAQAQRDLLAAQIDEVGALAAYRQALTALYRFDGSLLVRRAVAAPGEEPVE